MTKNTDLSCDVAVIGAGTAGLAAARRALREGARVLLIDEAFSGTMCANVGCMPSKLLIAAATAAKSVNSAGVFGIDVVNYVVDGPAVMKRVQTERDRFARATREGYSDFPEGTMIRSRARFVSTDILMLDDGRKILAGTVVIATGGKPDIPDAFAGLGSLCVTHEKIFDLRNLPKTIAVIGAGPIGLELAQAYSRLGVETTLFDDGETVGGVKDPEIQKLVQSVLGEQMRLRLGVDTAGERRGDAALVRWTGASSGSQTFELVLMAAGRPAYFAGLDLENAGVKLDSHGVPKYDRETMRCDDTSIFIAGDAASASPVLHEATWEGNVAGRNAAFFPAVTRTRRMTPLSMVFVDPVIAVVGAEPDDSTVVGKASFDDQGRARVDNEAVGEVRIYAEPSRGRLTGAVLFCPGAEHMAHLFVHAVSSGMTAAEMLAQPLYHPTLVEGLKVALRQICREVPSSGDYDQTVSSVY